MNFIFHFISLMQITDLGLTLRCLWFRYYLKHCYFDLGVWYVLQTFSVMLLAYTVTNKCYDDFSTRVHHGRTWKVKTTGRTGLSCKLSIRTLFQAMDVTFRQHHYQACVGQVGFKDFAVECVINNRLFCLTTAPAFLGLRPFARSPRALNYGKTITSKSCEITCIQQRFLCSLFPALNTSGCGFFIGFFERSYTWCILGVCCMLLIHVSHAECPFKRN